MTSKVALRVRVWDAILFTWRNQTVQLLQHPTPCSVPCQGLHPVNNITKSIKERRGIKKNKPTQVTIDTTVTMYDHFPQALHIAGFCTHCCKQRSQKCVSHDMVHSDHTQPCIPKSWDDSSLIQLQLPNQISDSLLLFI